MSNLAVLPIVIPLLASVILAFIPKKTKASRFLAKLFAVVYLGYSAFLSWVVFSDGIIVMQASGWIAPFGISIVADYLSVVLVLITSIITTAAVFYAPNSLEKLQENHYFYTFVFLMIAGVTGAFLTGDLFNLFVFFEVLLMASYGLIVLGGGKVQLRESGPPSPRPRRRHW